MAIRDMTLSDVDRLDAKVGDAEDAFEMDEDTFRAFYERTARPLWAYLARTTADPQLADDLLQESYYRFLRARVPWDGESHRRAYLFRIATNLVRDGHRRARNQGGVELPLPEDQAAGGGESDHGGRSAVRTDLYRAMAKLRTRDRALLWLAYAQGHAHGEIAATLGVKTGSIKLLLFRARRRLAGLLRDDRGGRTDGTR